jgi:hypothetical protein
MSDVLTWQEIERRYPDEWVLLDQLQSEGSLDVTGGRVVFHSKDRSDVYRKAAALKLADAALLFTGEADPELAFVL